MSNNIKSSNSHIFLAPTSDYSRQLLNLCDRMTLRDKHVVVITQGNPDFSALLEKPKSPVQLEKLHILMLKDIESAPRHIVALNDNNIPKPDLIIFDFYAIIAEICKWPAMQQCSTEPMVRLISNCAAAFCNYKEAVVKWKEDQAKAEPDINHGTIDTVIIMPTVSYPLTPGQFQLLIAIYFHEYACYVQFSQLTRCIYTSHGFT